MGRSEESLVPKLFDVDTVERSLLRESELRTIMYNHLLCPGIQEFSFKVEQQKKNIHHYIIFFRKPFVLILFDFTFDKNNIKFIAITKTSFP